MATKEVGNAAFTQGRYEEAITIYTEVINTLLANTSTTTTNAPAPVPTADLTTLYSNRAMAQLKLSQSSLALESCDAGIALDAKHEKLRLRRAQVRAIVQHFTSLRSTD